jgi:hypothetical protein
MNSVAADNLAQGAADRLQKITLETDTIKDESKLQQTKDMASDFSEVA